MEYPSSLNLVGQGSTSLGIYRDIHLHISLFNLENLDNSLERKDKYLILNYIRKEVVKNPNASPVPHS